MIGFAKIQSRAIVGLQALPVSVEVHMSNGLPSVTIVGLAETEVKEARERVRSALQNCGLEFPNNKRIVINLAPADLPKDSGRFDLPIAMGILAASGQIDACLLNHYEFAGELSLAGDLRPIRGALAMSLILRRENHQRQLVLPSKSAREAALVPHSTVYSAQHLQQLVQAFVELQASFHAKPPLATGTDGVTQTNDPVFESLRLNLPLAHGCHAIVSDPIARYADFSDVKGQAMAKRALEIAACGGHNVLLVGPPGSGKSMLAQRFGGLLDDMSTDEALETATIASLAGAFKIENWGQRPTRSPHHSASAVALVGGGSPPRPGEISLAHHGVLFLDELAELSRTALEALREPLETGHITISRAAHRAEFPAHFQLIAAMNPCPCGYLGTRSAANNKTCRCTPDQVLRYQNKISGPLLDRIDLLVDVAAVNMQELLQAPKGESSSSIKQRCHKARNKALQRQSKNNQSLQNHEIDTFCKLDDTAGAFLNAAATRLNWSARATHRSLKVARTIADLADSEHIQTSHIAEAIQYRRTLHLSQ